MLNEWRERLTQVGQQHLLQFASQLSAEEQQHLERQLAEIDFAEFERLRTDHLNQVPAAPTQAVDRAEPPDAVRLADEPRGFTRAQARERGEAALRAGEVGMILVAGGLGTRLGFDLPKGMFPVGPLSRRTLFQVFIDRLRAVARRYGTSIPLFIMTSPATHDLTARYMAEHARHGLPADDLHLFQQGTMYAVDAQSFEILLAGPGEIFTGPDGHGGMLAALEKNGCLKLASERGLRHFFYGQIDNPLLTVCNPEFMGCHLLSGSELTTQAVAKTDPAERVGVLASIEGRTQIIEYVDLPKAAAEARDSNGQLKFWAGNTGVHAFDIAFLARTASNKASLPFHTARKKVPFINKQGDRVEPNAPNAIRFERFIFDLLPLARQPLVIEVDKAEAFAPVKNDDSAPTDSPTTARAAMVAQAQRLLRAADVAVDDNTVVEINPLWAMTPDDIKTQLPNTARIDQPTYFS